MKERGNFKIRRVHSVNFKGFKEFEFENISNLTLLGGKNGYGKTTVFDIIELVLTGSISRISNYVNKDDGRLTLDCGHKPLVHDPKSENVKVELEIELDGQVFCLIRQALVEDMKNPVDFTPFKQLYFRNQKDKEFVEIESSEIGQQIKMLSDKYNFLYYLEQEESTLFLKKDVKDRIDDINSLFDTNSFDEDSKKIDEVIGKIDEIKKINDEKIKNVDREIDNLPININASSGEKTEYSRLFKYDVKWDSENPEMSVGEYFEILKENGVISQIEYYLDNKDAYRKNTLITLLRPFVETTEWRYNLAIYVYFSQFKQDINLYYEHHKGLTNFYNSLTPANISSFDMAKYPIANNILSQKAILELKTMSKEITELYAMSNSTQKAYADLMNRRHPLIQLLNSSDFIDTKDCPLCGRTYNSNQDLIEAIDEQSKTLKEIGDNISKLFDDMFNRFKVKFINEILSPLEEKLKSLGITDSVVKVIEDDSIRRLMKTLCDRYDIVLSPKDSVEKTHESISNFLSTLGSYDDTIDYQSIQRILISFSELEQNKELTKDKLSAKRLYLVNLFNEVSSKKLADLNREKEKLIKMDRSCKNKKRDLKKMKDEIRKQKNSYLKQLISDIEILFYIYTGRIMQDNFFGRGLFMKLRDNKCVLFVSGDYNNDIDALYRMSSGQLSALIIAFTIAINKLYAYYKFLAIDDPAQTMDDMNLWGLIDTLRHEFRDYNIILATHEENVGALINYKAHKVKISSYYYDMSKISGR